MKRLIITAIFIIASLKLEVSLASPDDYVVLGVIASSHSNKGVALIKSKKDEKIEAFQVGDNIQADLKIEKVERKIVTFLYQNKHYSMGVGDDRSIEINKLDTNNISLNLKNAEGIEVNGNTLRVTHTLKESLTGENLNKVLMQAAAVPYTDNGRLVGFELLAIDPGSIFDVAGFKNGDIVTQINQQPISDAALAIRALNSLRTANSATFGYIRDSSNRELIVQIK